MKDPSEESGWDDLAEDLGLKEKKAQRSEGLKIHDPGPIESVESDDFGSDSEEPEPLYDPGPGEIADADDTEFGEALDAGESGEIDELGEPDSTPGGAEPAPGQEGRKKKRRRRRKKKKGGEGAPEGQTAGESVGASAPAAVAVATEEEELAEGEQEVEEADAPQAMDDDESGDEPPHSAMDEEMDEVASLPKQEWKVMTWNELIAKLHRPN